MAHQLLTVLELSALLEKSLGVGLLCSENVRVDVFVHGAARNLRHVVPVDLELGHTWLLGEDVSREALDDGCCRRVFVELRGVVLYVDIVANTKELLAVLVGACKKDGCDSDDVVDRQVIMVRCITLYS